MRGVAAWYAGRIKVVAVEPELVPAMHTALAAGEATDVIVGPSIAADSLGAKRIGAVPFAVAKAFVNDSVLVADDDIRQAQRVFWEDLRLMIEPGGAAAYAALMSGRVPAASGANEWRPSSAAPTSICRPSPGDAVEHPAFVFAALSLTGQAQVLEVRVGLALGHRAPRTLREQVMRELLDGGRPVELL